MTRDDILGVLAAAAPASLTTDQVAERLKAQTKVVGSHLSKLALYGQIDRSFSLVPGRRPDYPRRRIASYCAKQEAAHV